MASIVIQSTANDRVKWVRQLQTKRRARHQESVFVAEGTRWGRALLAAGVRPRAVFHLADDGSLGDLANRLNPDHAACHPVSDSVMRAMSSTESPPGLLMVIDQPDLQPPKDPRLALVVDGLSDPGNMGTLLRTSLAAGVDLIWVLPDTVDPFNPKVVRAGMGAQLHLPILTLPLERLSAALADMPLWLMDANGPTVYHAVDWRAPCALAVGSEAHGPRPQLGEMAAGIVRIPMEDAAESLNAAIAAAIVIFEIRRQRTTL